MPMSALREAMSHAVLGWVKPELDETLRLVRRRSRPSSRDPRYQPHAFLRRLPAPGAGHLRMVELYAPAMVAEELELLAKALQDGACRIATRPAPR
jgi:chemosensory pili system protein ChpA (sensor histidine kinase/response regulator)